MKNTNFIIKSPLLLYFAIRRKNMKKKENSLPYLIDTFELHDFKIPFFPFKPITNHVATKTFNYGNWHDPIEILQINEGSGNIIIDTTNNYVEKGDVIIANSNEVHRITSETKLIYSGIVISTDFLSQNGIDPEKSKFITKINDDKLDELLTRAIKIVKTATSDPAFIPRSRLYTLELLIYLIDNYIETDDSKLKKRQGIFIHSALQYINENYCKSISLEDVSKNIGISKYHLLRQFKLNTGYTIVTYINILRCSQAKRLLKTGLYSVNEVARMCGYESLPYFTTTFKKYTGVLPSKYTTKQ